MEKLFLDHPWIVAGILLWTLPWKGVALWIAARRGHIGWFFVLLVLNTLAIFDIVYIFIFSRWGLVKKDQTDSDEQESAEFGRGQFQENIKRRSTIL